MAVTICNVISRYIRLQMEHIRLYTQIDTDRGTYTGGHTEAHTQTYRQTDRQTKAHKAYLLSLLSSSQNKKLIDIVIVLAIQSELQRQIIVNIDIIYQYMF